MSVVGWCFVGVLVWGVVVIIYVGLVGYVGMWCDWGCCCCENILYCVISQGGEDEVAKSGGDVYRLVGPVVGSRMGVEEIDICMQEEEDSTVDLV